MDAKQKKLSVALLIALVGFPQISETIYTPALPNVAEGLQASPYMVEATLAIYFLGFALGVLLWGTVSDKSGRKNAMLAGLFLYGIATYGCANVVSVETLLTWRFLQAFGASVGSVITQTILRDAYEGSERTKLFSVMSGALAFSPALGPVLGGLISQFFGWRANFWVLVILALVLTVWTCLSLPETLPKHLKSATRQRIFHLFTEMMTSCALWGHILLIGATNGILFGFYQEAPFIFIEQLGIKPGYYGLFGLLIAASTIFAARISYRYSARFSSQAFIRCGAVCVLSGGIFFALTVMTGLLEFKLVGLFITVLALFGIFFGIGLIIPNSLSHALKLYQTTAGTAGSIFGGCYYCLIAISTWGMSIFHNGTALPLPLYMIGLGVLVMCGSQMIRQSRKIQETIRN